MTTTSSPRGPQPDSIATAVKLIWAQIGLSLVSAVITFAMLDTIIDQALEDAGATSTITEDTIRNGAIFGAGLGLVVGVVLYALLAVFLTRGQSWARVLLTILGGFSLLFGLLGMLGAQPMVLQVITLVGLVLTAAMLWFLWQKESSAWLAGRA